MWIPIAALAAIYFSVGGPYPPTAYDIRWASVALVLLAVLGRTYALAAVLAAAVALAGALYFGFAYLVQVVAGQPERWPYVVGALLVLGLSALQLVRRARRDTFFDPVILVAAQLGVASLCRWLYYLVSGVGLDPSGYVAGTITTPFRTELPLLALGLAAVGFGLTRTWGPAMDRLGIVVPRWWQLVVAFAVADIFLVSVGLVNNLTFFLVPDQWHRIVEILYRTYSPLPGWALLLFAVLAGVSEETLFRGALQPRAGVILTAILFAAGHIQYGLTPILGMVFVHGIGYGLLRRYMNTSTAIVAHTAYDSGGFPLSHLSEANALWAVLLVAVVAIDVWRARRTVAA